MQIIIGIFIGVPIGLIIMGLLAGSKHGPTDEDCWYCKRAYEEQIHGLRSSKGKLGAELQRVMFLKAREN